MSSRIVSNKEINKIISSFAEDLEQANQRMDAFNKVLVERSERLALGNRLWRGYYKVVMMKNYRRLSISNKSFKMFVLPLDRALVYILVKIDNINNFIKKT